MCIHGSGQPYVYMYAVYDHRFENPLQAIPYMHSICIVLANPKQVQGLKLLRVLVTPARSATSYHVGLK